MIIHRAFYRETGKTALAIALVLVVMFVFLSLTVLLGRTARGDFGDEVILTLLGLQILKRLDLLLPLSLYLGILLTLSRWYRDSEMTVLAACGVGLPQLLRPVLTLAAVFCLAVALLAFWLNPLATRHAELAKSESAGRSELSLVTPGVFTDAAGGKRVLYTEALDPYSGEFRGVFVTNLNPPREGVVLAGSGRPFTDTLTQTQYLILSGGAYYEGRPGETEHRQVTFERLLLRIEPRKAVEVPVSVSAMPTLALLRQSGPEISAEFHWRLARPVSGVILALFALTLAYTDARRGRLSNLFAAVLVYFIYSNLLSLGQALLRKGKMPEAVGMWWVHGLMLAIALYLLWRRAHNQPLLAWPRSKAGASC
jgi:lipopolysaccharide export system permease protein